MLDLLIILRRCSSYERTHMVLFSSVFLSKTDMSVEFQQLLAVLDVFKIACAFTYAVRLGILAWPMLPVLSLHPDPSVPFTRGRCHSQQGCYRNLPSSAYQPWPIWKTAEIELEMSFCSHLSLPPMAQSYTTGELFRIS